MSSYSNIRALSISKIGIPSLMGYASLAFLLISSFVSLLKVSGPLVFGHTKIFNIFGSIDFLSFSTIRKLDILLLRFIGILFHVFIRIKVH